MAQFRTHILPLWLAVMVIWGAQPFVSGQAAAAAFRKEPYLVFNGNNTQMKIIWQLDGTASAALEWGIDTRYQSGHVTTQEYNGNHQHAYTVHDLTPGGKYFYRVTVGGTATTGAFVAAPPVDAANLNLFAYGDTRTNPNIHNQVAGEVVKTFRADASYQSLILSVGDLVSNGDQEAMWDSEFFRAGLGNIRAMMANMPLVSARGNHEESGVLFKKYFPMPYLSGHYWSFDYGPMHVVVLDQYMAYAKGSAQYNWLVNDLKASPKLWKVIVLHEPGWSAGGGHENNRTVQTEIQPLAKQYGVALVLGGHNHYYARAVVDGVQHLTVGGGGAPLAKPDQSQPNVVKAVGAYSYVKISINGSTLKGTAVKIDGSVIDSFTVQGSTPAPVTIKVFLPVIEQ